VIVNLGNHLKKFWKNVRG